MLAVKPKHLRRSLPVLIVALVVMAVAGCASPRQKTSKRGIGKPPPEQASIVYRQPRTTPLITPESDPFAAH